MPTNLTIVHPEDFIRVTQTGAVDIEASRELLREIVSRLKATGVHHVLIDMRQTTPEVFESVARVHGRNVQAFTDFEPAITWLAIAAPARVSTPAVVI